MFESDILLHCGNWMWSKLMETVVDFVRVNHSATIDSLIFFLLFSDLEAMLEHFSFEQVKLIARKKSFYFVT